MARIKQTARKSTGGHAPRKPLSNRHRRYYYHYGKRPSNPKRKLGKQVECDTVPVRCEPSSSAAQQEVLSTPDLLVIILSQLPHSSLLKAQRVNRTWASLFGHAEIQAALFQQPRTKEPALYVEQYSDILMDRFSPFWPRKQKDRARFSGGWKPRAFHPKEYKNVPVNASKGHDPTGKCLRDATTAPPQQQPKLREKCPYEHQWRNLLICQPPIESLELVQTVGIRGNRSGHPEFRAVVSRPGGLRMGFLYDAIRHWHEVERSEASLLWNRRTGHLINNYDIYPDGSDFTTNEDKPCLTILGKSSVGCGQYGGLTYSNYGAQKTQAIQSGDEEVKYLMSGPKSVDVDWGLFRAYMENGWREREREARDENEDEPEDEEEESEDQEEENSEDEE